VESERLGRATARYSRMPTNLRICYRRVGPGRIVGILMDPPADADSRNGRAEVGKSEYSVELKIRRLLIFRDAKDAEGRKLR